MFQNDNNSSYRLAVLHVAQCPWDISLVLPLVLVALVDMLVQEPANALSVFEAFSDQQRMKRSAELI